jgi:hypothetical protein
MACLLVVGFLSIAPVANAASARPSVNKPTTSARNTVMKVKHPGRRARIHLPIGPSYIYNDYPYYYSRGYYPTHIGGYIYYPYYHRRYYPRQVGPGSPRRREAPRN